MTVDTWITVGIAVVLLLFVIRGAFRGLSGEIAPLAGLIVCGLVIFFGYTPCHAMIGSFFTEDQVKNGIFFSALSVSVAGILCYFMIAAFVKRIFAWILPQPFNAILGALLSGAKGVLFISIIAGLYTITQEKLGTLKAQQEQHPLTVAATAFWKARLGQAGSDFETTAKAAEEAIKEAAD